MALLDDGVDDCWNRIGVWGSQQPRCPVLDDVIHCRNCSVYSSAGRHLLEREAPAGYMDEWSEVLAGQGQAATEAALAMLVFRIGDEWLGLTTRVVREISKIRPMHRIPHRNDQVLGGLVNVRGELLVAISLGSLFGIRKAERYTSGHVEQSYAERLIVIEQRGANFAFPVSEIYGIHRYRQGDLREVPATIDHSGASYMRGMLTLDPWHVGCLNEEELFESLARCLK